MANDDRRSRDDSRPLTSVAISKEAMDSLTCSICLELLYKPVVTACGHMFCFWCGHHGMNAFTASSCPLCRRSFMYFPRVCKLLHFMLMKAVPDEYTRRGLEARRHEEELRMFSPELASEDLLAPPDSKHGDASTTSDVNTQIGTDHDHSMLSCPKSNSKPQCGQEGEEDNSRQGNLTQEMFAPDLAPEDLLVPTDSKHGDASTSDMDTQVGTDHHHSMLSSPESNSNSQCGQEGEEDNSRQGNLTKDDLCCALCHRLLYRPVVLNCGDVFCEPCLKMHSFKVDCPSCRAPHPAVSVLVCLELDHIVQSAFPVEYANRRLQHSAESTPFPDRDSVDGKLDADLHFCVGCDGCGMFPIIGDRYQCEDCKEVVGYDLCGSCYNNTGSLMGRFNQKHQPTHQMKKVLHTHDIEQVLRAFRLADYSAD